MKPVDIRKIQLGAARLDLPPLRLLIEMGGCNKQTTSGVTTTNGFR